MRCYRIVRHQHATTALSGEGARIYGGRWNPPGWRCVYVAESRSLAVLEMLVHLSGRSRGLTYRLISLEIPDDSISVATPATLPAGWDALPAGEASQMVGENWLQAGRTLALRVPSVLIPEESNLLLNPLADGFGSIRVLDEREFQLDLRFQD
jgi:RES domain-containing protein